MPRQLDLTSKEGSPFFQGRNIHQKIQIGARGHIRQAGQFLPRMTPEQSQSDSRNVKKVVAQGGRRLDGADAFHWQPVSQATLFGEGDPEKNFTSILAEARTSHDERAVVRKPFLQAGGIPNFTKGLFPGACRQTHKCMAAKVFRIAGFRQ